MENETYLYSVFDTGAELFGPLFDAVNDAVAARNYKVMLDKIDPRFRADYMLYRMAKFNIKNGSIEPESQPLHVFTDIQQIGGKL